MGPNEGAASQTAAAVVSENYVPRKRAQVLELDLGDGVVIYDDQSSLVHHLNPSASLVWHLCRGEASVRTLAAEIAEELGLELPQVLAEVRGLVAELDALGLVEDAAGPPAR
ncbi:MAG TPA: PqqD family protein [Actinomycetota bacterium]|nr:PqqD family protein [Actinomycetota bacterium]